MIHQVVDRVHTVVVDNFNGIYATLALAAGTTALTPVKYKRVSAERFKHRTANGLGVYQDGGATTRRRPGAGSNAAIRDTQVVVVLDWYLRHTDEDLIALQTEVAIQTALRVIDLLPNSTDIVHAAEGDEAVTWTIERSELDKDSRVATERALIRFPCFHRETGL